MRCCAGKERGSVWRLVGNKWGNTESEGGERKFLRIGWESGLSKTRHYLGYAIFFSFPQLGPFFFFFAVNFSGMYLYIFLVIFLSRVIMNIHWEIRSTEKFLSTDNIKSGINGFTSSFISPSNHWSHKSNSKDTPVTNDTIKLDHFISCLISTSIFSNKEIKENTTVYFCSSSLFSGDGKVRRG